MGGNGKADGVAKVRIVSKNCFLSWLQLAEVTTILAKGQFKRHQRAAATRTFDVLPAPLPAVRAVAWPDSV
jgi:hypothetical protein